MGAGSRNWAAVFYMDSCPADWPNIVADWHVPCLVSPLHDSDVDQNGELKKPHYHILFVFEGNKTFDQMVDMVSQLGVNYVEKVASRMGYERYLCHLDNPDKYQYDISEVKCFGGLKPKFLIDEEYRDGVIGLSKIIEEFGIVRYAHLSYLVATRYPEYMNALLRYTVHFNNYLRDRLDMTRYNSDNLSYVKSVRFGFIDSWES